jgi:hypothetical protein
MSKPTKICFYAVLTAAAMVVPWHTAVGGDLIKSGSVAFLKQERRVNLEYDDTGMKVGRNAKDSVPMEEFIARENQKQAGHGDIWKLEWTGQRTLQYQPKFQELLNKQFAADNVQLEFGTFKDAKYTLILKTKIMMTGKPWPPFPYPPKITADAVFEETNNRTNPVAVVNLVNVPGQSLWGPDMSEAYAKAGKDLGILIRGKIK